MLTCFFILSLQSLLIDSQMMMKAIRITEFGEPCVLKLIEKLNLPKPSDNEVLIEVKYSGVNPVDTYRRSGKYNPLPSLPWTPGSDCSGVILETGSKVHDKFSKGQRVYTTSTITGSYASHAIVSVNHLHSLPDKLSFQQGASLGVPYFTAYSALFQRGQAKPQETVLIHGASGSVGIACIQMAKASNLTVIGTAGTKEGIDLIKKLGVDHAFNHRDEDYISKLKEAFGGKINLTIEMLANQNLVTDCELSALHGRIMIVGSRGTLDFDPRLTMGKLLDIRGVALGMNSVEQWLEANNAIDKWLEDGVINPIVWKEYELVDAPMAHHDIIFNSGKFGKLVLKI